MVAAANIIQIQLQAHLCFKFHDYRICSAPDAPGLLVFTALTIMLYEGLAVTMRFINFHFINAFNKAALALVRMYVMLAS